MKTFRCDTCGQTLYFENDVCTQCGSELAFVPELGGLYVVHEAGAARAGSGEPFSVGPERAQYRHCANRLDYSACNWAVPAERGVGARCESCALNDIVPDLSDANNRARWSRLEVAKRRLLWALNQFPLSYAPTNDQPGLRFRFLANVRSDPPVTTGHGGGVITINIDEADPACREATREELGERYRTPLGHFRHESGHFYWDRLIAPVPERLESFRSLFGDERKDYQTALQDHYATDSANAPAGYVSAYAAAHPWEDWAESWAHYLHMQDTLETAQVHRLVAEDTAVPANADFDDMLGAWQQLSVALNSLSRSMGTPDPYPFAPGQQALKKMRFVHDIIREAALRAREAAPG